MRESRIVRAAILMTATTCTVTATVGVDVGRALENGCGRKERREVQFITFDTVRRFFAGKSVAIIGSAPSCLESSGDLIDSHDIVLRVNNFKTKGFEDRVGARTDVHYSFYGTSIKTTADELKRGGVRLCLCKCPNAKPIKSEWHERRAKPHGVDFTYIYKLREHFWFTDTYVPDVASFMEKFNLLGGHIPTTGFAAILDVLACPIARATLIGFDFFSSKKHNVNEPWRPGDPSDPIGHRPDLEAQWIADNAHKYLLTLDETMSRMVNKLRVAA